MAEGPGKYDKLATWVRERAKAQGIVLAVLGGEKGNGFSAQFAGRDGQQAEMLRATAQVLREIAGQIDADAAELERGVQRN